MFIYEKKLQYPVKIDRPNPKLAAVIISQYGGPDGELGASMRYLSQRYSMPFDEPNGTGYRLKIHLRRNCLTIGSLTGESTTPFLTITSLAEKIPVSSLCLSPLPLSSYGNLGRKIIYDFFRVRKAPAKATINTMGAILTNIHSKPWKITPTTAYSGSL